MTKLGKAAGDEKEVIDTFGPPLRCPKCGHDIFARTVGSSEEVKLLYGGDEIVPHVVNAEYTDNLANVDCAKCGQHYGDMNNLIPKAP